MTKAVTLPESIKDEKQLHDVLTQPSQELVEFVRTLNGPLLILGAGGKMGPTLAVRVRRAAEAAGVPLAIIAVSRFTNPLQRTWLEERGITTAGADLFCREAIDGLPDAENVIYLVGTKFGTSKNPSLTWAANTLIPSYVAERYKQSRLVALSTGNVYPLVPVDGGGSVETDALTPLGEYANAAVARERIFEYWSRRNNTPLALIRLNYAIDLRYGVLTDLARKIANNEPVDLTTGFLNCVWQGDANDMIVRSLGLTESPPRVLNLTGPEALSVRSLAEALGKRMNKQVHFTGREAETALLNNSSLSHRLLGAPPISIETMLSWTANWISQGGRLLDKPTGFEVRDGKF